MSGPLGRSCSEHLPVEYIHSLTHSLINNARTEIERARATSAGYGCKAMARRLRGLRESGWLSRLLPSASVRFSFRLSRKRAAAVESRVAARSSLGSLLLQRLSPPRLPNTDAAPRLLHVSVNNHRFIQPFCHVSLFKSSRIATLFGKRLLYCLIMG